MQTLIGILIGAVVAALAYAVYWLIRSVRDLREALLTTAEVFAKAGSLGKAMEDQVNVSRRLVSAVESMTASIGLFNSLVVTSPGAEPIPEEPTVAPQRPSRPRGPLPLPPIEDRYATEDEAGVLAQSDEDLAGIEQVQELREIGIETDPDRLPLPDADKVNLFQS